MFTAAYRHILGLYYKAYCILTLTWNNTINIRVIFNSHNCSPNIIKRYYLFVVFNFRLSFTNDLLFH